MANKRMFSKQIIDSDAFLDMSSSARLLYYDLGMRADDDGFVNSPKKILRMTGASIEDLNELIKNKFIIDFKEVVCIKHWKIHNTVRKDTYHETTYKKYKILLETDENGAYRLIRSRNEVVTNTEQPNENVETQNRLDKTSIDKNSINHIDSIDIYKDVDEVVTNPSLNEVDEYIKRMNWNVNAFTFWNYFNDRDWLDITGEQIRNWKAMLKIWNDKVTGNRKVIEAPSYIEKQMNNNFGIGKENDK